MRIFYEQKIQEVCKAFQFPNKIQVCSTYFAKLSYYVCLIPIVLILSIDQELFF
jgi:hypothetical protein